jgi:outer membrane protein assembly factor BamD
MIHRYRILFILVVLSLFLLAGCKVWLPWQTTTGMARANPESLYQQGLEEYNQGRYKRAIELFQRVKEEYPLSQLAIMAEMGIADSFFSGKQYPEAALAYEEFLDLHPTNENLPYVMYQIGMCYFNQLTTVDRDNSEAFKALVFFERLTARFPESEFSVLGREKIRECKKNMGEKELYVGQFYLKQKKYVAALKRLKKVEKDYSGVGLDDKKVKVLITEATNRLAAKGKKKSR